MVICFRSQKVVRLIGLSMAVLLGVSGTGLFSRPHPTAGGHRLTPSWARMVGIPCVAGPVQAPTRRWEATEQSGLEQLPRMPKADGGVKAPYAERTIRIRSVPLVPASLYP